MNGDLDKSPAPHDSASADTPALRIEGTRTEPVAVGVTAGGDIPKALKERIEAASHWNALPPLSTSQTITPSSLAYELARELTEARNEIARLSLFADACEAAERSSRSDVTKADRLERELSAARAEVERMEAALGKLYWYITNGKLSKPYDFEAIEAEIDDAITETVKEESAAAHADAERLREALEAMPCTCQVLNDTISDEPQYGGRWICKRCAALTQPHPDADKSQKMFPTEVPLTECPTCNQFTVLPNGLCTACCEDQSGKHLIGKQPAEKEEDEAMTHPFYCPFCGKPQTTKGICDACKSASADTPSCLDKGTRSEPPAVGVTAGGDISTPNDSRDKGLRISRPGDWMDEWGACKVCRGEVPYGHINECSFYKLERELAAAIRERDEALATLHSYSDESAMMDNLRVGITAAEAERDAARADAERLAEALKDHRGALCAVRHNSINLQDAKWQIEVDKTLDVGKAALAAHGEGKS